MKQALDDGCINRFDLETARVDLRRQGDENE